MHKTEQEIIETMSTSGLRITEQRKTMIRLFVEDKGYWTPKQVYKQMNEEYAGLSFDTVYRNLRLLCDIGILEQFVFEEGIKFRLHCADEHHHHLICLECEKTYSIDFCPVDLVSDIPKDFEVVRHKFELYGYCQQCKS